MSRTDTNEEKMSLARANDMAVLVRSNVVCHRLLPFAKFSKQFCTLASFCHQNISENGHTCIYDQQLCSVNEACLKHAKSIKSQFPL